jgi:hypothetical protein
MKRKLHLFIMLLCAFFVQQNVKSQTTLAAGDIAFIGYQTAGSDGFSFITLKAMNTGTLLYLTERGWGNGTWVSGSTEPHLLWTVPAFTPAGTIVSIVETATADVFTVTGTTQASITLALGTSFNLSGGDQMLAYQSSTGAQPASPTFIAGVHADYNLSDYDATTKWNTTAATGGNSSSLPPGLTNGVNCVSLFPGVAEVANSKYSGTLTGTVAALLTSINNYANWSHHATNDLGIVPSGFPTPAVATAIAPTVTTTTASNIKSVSATIGGNVTADGGDATIERGIVWATTANPTIANNKFQIGTGTGVFSNTVTGFPAGTLIHYRAYATNGAGTGYGTGLTLTTGAALNTSSTPQTNVSCNGGNNGTATVIVTGGTTPYSYSWSPSGGTGATASSLTAGSYTVTITDGESTQITRNFTITESPILTGITSTTAVSCFGGANGTATIAASGGTPGYTYSWAPSGGNAATATGLTAGTYSVTITDASSCTKTITGIVVGGPTAILNGTPSATNVSCFGGSNGTASITPTGGTPGYTYLWNTGETTATITGLVPGNYTVLITDANSCQKTVTGIMVGEPATAVTATSSTTSISCFGGTNGTATVVASGGTPGYTYLWAPSGGTGATATGLAAGTYSVTVRDANLCTFTVNNIIVGQPASALTGTPGITSVSCNGGTNGTATVVASGGTPGYTYLWSNGATTATASGLSAGTYSVTITDANSCTTTINNIIVGQPAVITANPSQINVSCNGGNNGSATVAPSGGNGSYTYLWSNGVTTATASDLTQGNYTVTITDATLCSITQNFTITEPAALVASQGTINNVSCNGGSNGTATVVTAGGTGPYTYLWSPSGGTGVTATGLSAGTYTVTVTDNKLCQTTQNFTITEPDWFSVTSLQTDILCSGAATGSATVNVTGGTGAYTYSWSPSGGTGATATGLIAGTYNVTIKDANLCQTTKTFTITQPSTLVAIAAAQTNIGCRGDATGSATVNVTGGTGAYTYSWAPSGGTAATATGLTAGTYTVTVKDANLCQTTQSFTITQPAAILSATTASIGVSCFGGSNGSASVSVSGGTPGYTYLWAPLGGSTATITGKPAGNYTCTITDANGCTLVKNITINTPPVLSVSSIKTNVSCNGGTNGSATVNVSGGTPGYTYLWAPSGGTAATATGLAAGTYTVTISDANTCQTTATVTINQPAALSAMVFKTDILCNGQANGTASVVVSGGTSEYTYAWSPSGGTAATATGLKIGSYNCLITDANGCTITKNVTINQPAVLSAATAQINATCVAGGQASVTPVGGTSPYNYSWFPSGGTAAVATGLLAGNYTCLISDNNGCSISKNFTITTTNTLTATTSQTNILCNGTNTGTATVVPAGAPGPFTYLWAPGGGTAATATGLTAGNYSVTITSGNGCSIVKNFTITQPNPIVITPSQTNITCNGGTNGSATVSVTGGTGAYTYLWTPYGGTASTATGLSAGTYNVTITDANLCQKTQSFTITEPAALTALATATNVICNGANNGSATVNVTGGTGIYTYLWSPLGGNAATASGLASGSYSVLITDANSCSITKNVTITEPALLTASVGTQTNISCNGLSDGAVSINVTGGVTPYTYLWSNGSTTKDISGLAAGNYTITISDANNCSAIQSVTLITIPDVTAPVPNVASLPEIASYCSVLSSQIPIPTATDNCAGIINGTTSNLLNYTAEGSYTITWSFNDGNGNISTQNQTLKVIASPLNQVTFSNAEYTFDGNLHTLQVANLPVGASVAYTTNPSTGTLNGAINAGVYTVTATVTPSVTTPNCSPVILTANLTIKKAAQQITFGALAPRILGANNNFNLQATSNSGLPVHFTFTYTSALPPANVSSTGLVSMLRSGELLITAHQDGNENYLPATDVSQILIIKNNDITVQSITIGTKVYNNPAKDIIYIMSCGENNPNIAIVNQTNATITPAASFAIATPKPGIYTQNVTITSQDGTATANYTIKVEKPFSFYDIVKQKFNNVLLVNNNPQTNGGYEFVSYQWFKNGQLVGTDQYYSAGNDANSILDTSAIYSVKMTTKDGKVLQTCGSTIILQNSLQAKLYPNPIEAGKVITIEADFPEEELQNMQITLFSVSGKLIKTVQSSTVKTEIQLPEITESNMYLVVLESGNIKKSFKVIVK